MKVNFESPSQVLLPTPLSLGLCKRTLITNKHKTKEKRKNTLKRLKSLKYINQGSKSTKDEFIYSFTIFLMTT